MVHRGGPSPQLVTLLNLLIKIKPIVNFMEKNDDFRKFNKKTRFGIMTEFLDVLYYQNHLDHICLKDFLKTIRLKKSSSSLTMNQFN